MTSLANVEGEESFEPSYLGEAAEVSQERISDDELILIKGTKVWTNQNTALKSVSVLLTNQNIDFILYPLITGQNS